MKPRILLVSTCRWSAPARLGMAFVDLGCEVEAVCPRVHPLGTVDAVSRIHRFRALRSVKSIGSAIEAAAPDLVVPCDDLATECLHALHAHAIRTGASAVATLISRSLGSPDSFPIVAARARVMELAKAQGVRVPATAAVYSDGAMSEWASRHGLPAILKADATCGGRGVRLVDTVPEAVRLRQYLEEPSSILRAVKRALVNGDRSHILPCLRRRRAVVNVQQYIRGQDANATVACWKGNVLGAISVVVLKTLDAYGPASVVRVIENREISEAVERIVSALGVSGLVGFDFMIDEGTGHAYLIEMNPRATQLGHLALGNRVDLPRSLITAAFGEVSVDRPIMTVDNVIALFPQEWLRDPSSPFLKTAYHDVPWQQPALMRDCLREPLAPWLWTAASARLHATQGARDHEVPCLATAQHVRGRK